MAEAMPLQRSEEVVQQLLACGGRDTQGEPLMPNLKALEIWSIQTLCDIGILLSIDIMADIKVGLPFVPLGTVALAGALLVKVFQNAETEKERGEEV